MTIFDEKTRALGWPASRFGGPRIIGHRGASQHATENTLTSFDLASQLGADMWELDVRNTADGVCVVSHDDDLSRVFGVDGVISKLTLAQLQALSGVHVPTLAEVVALAEHWDAGLYIEIKGVGSGQTALAHLKETGYPYAALGSFIPDYVAELASSGCAYPLSVLVRVGDDPFELAKSAKADAIHLCWERASDRPDHLLTTQLMAEAKAAELPIILWHEERPAVIKAVMAMDVAGVCTDRPELLVPYTSSPARPSLHAKGAEIVCHRGVNKLAPENTLPAAELTFDQGFDWLEIDVRQSADGELFVIHDQTVDRTTNGTGPVDAMTAVELEQLDAGSWFSGAYSGQFARVKLPTLAEIVALAKAYDKKLYVEIKQADPAKILSLLDAEDFLHHCFFWSFDRSLTDALRALSPQACIMARTLDFDTVEAAVASVGADIIEVNMIEPHVEQKVQDIRSSKAKVMLCYSGQDIETFEQMHALAPDFVNVDSPHIWKEVWNHAHSKGE